MTATNVMLFIASFVVSCILTEGLYRYIIKYRIAKRSISRVVGAVDEDTLCRGPHEWHAEGFVIGGSCIRDTVCTKCGYLPSLNAQVGQDTLGSIKDNIDRVRRIKEFCDKEIDRLAAELCLDREDVDRIYRDGMSCRVKMIVEALDKLLLETRLKSEGSKDDEQ